MDYQSLSLDKPYQYSRFHALLGLHATLANLLYGQSAHQLTQCPQYHYHELHGLAEAGQKTVSVEAHLERH